MPELTPEDRAILVVIGWQDHRDEAPSLVNRIAAAITEATADLAAKLEAAERERERYKLAYERTGEECSHWAAECAAYLEKLAERTDQRDEARAQLAAVQAENAKLREAVQPLLDREDIPSDEFDRRYPQQPQIEGEFEERSLSEIGWFCWFEDFVREAVRDALTRTTEAPHDPA